jgi:hypothetical protein
MELSMNISELAKFRGGVSVDTISELTSASGVTVDGVLLKDSAVSAASGVSTNTITEYSSGSGVTADGVLLKDNTVTASGVSTNTISEYASGSGVTVDGLLIKDGGIFGSTSGSAPSTGFVGEFLEASGNDVTTNTSAETTIATLTLTTGVWSVSAASNSRAAATQTGAVHFLTVKGSYSGANGVDLIQFNGQIAGSAHIANFATRRVVIAAGDANKTVVVAQRSATAAGLGCAHITAIRIA